MSWKPLAERIVVPARSQRYTFAVCVTSIAVVVTLLVTPWLEDFPLLILLTAVMASALWGGSGPGLVGTSLSGIAMFGATRFLASRFSIPPVNAGAEVVRLVIFLLVATGIALLAGARERVERERDALLVRERTARAEAETANGAKDRFLAAVSHELRNPLGAILSWASVASAAPAADDTVRRALEAIERNARSQRRLIDDLLDISRIVAGRLSLSRRPVELFGVIQAALETVRHVAEGKGVHVSLELDPRTVVVRGDPDRLQQVVSNLLSNAVKFTPEGGHVTIRLGRLGRYAELRVHDTGCGIPPDLLPHVFEPFWQAESASGSDAAGLGLGLSIVRQLVDLHGGHVSAHSRGAGEGALFRVTLPLVEAGTGSGGGETAQGPLHGEVASTGPNGGDRPRFA